MRTSLEQRFTERQRKLHPKRQLKLQSRSLLTCLRAAPRRCGLTRVFFIYSPLPRRTAVPQLAGGPGSSLGAPRAARTPLPGGPHPRRERSARPLLPSPPLPTPVSLLVGGDSPGRAVAAAAGGGQPSSVRAQSSAASAPGPMAAEPGRGRGWGGAESSLRYSVRPSVRPAQGDASAAEARRLATAGRMRKGRPRAAEASSGGGGENGAGGDRLPAAPPRRRGGAPSCPAAGAGRTAGPRRAGQSVPPPQHSSPANRRPPPRRKRQRKAAAPSWEMGMGSWARAGREGRRCGRKGLSQGISPSGVCRIVFVQSRLVVPHGSTVTRPVEIVVLLINERSRSFRKAP